MPGQRSQDNINRGERSGIVEKVFLECESLLSCFSEIQVFLCRK